MPSITTWQRLEGSTRRRDMLDGLRAALHDPLWQLARQHQLGAFVGEDAATPIAVTLQAESSQLTRYRAGTPDEPGGEARDYDWRTLPLETMVEREAVDRSPGRSLRLAAEAGVRFVEFLIDGGVGAALADRYRTTFPLTRPAGALPSETSRFLDVAARRVPDGNALYAAFRPPGTVPGSIVIPSDPAVPAGDQAAVRAGAEAWVAWYDELFSQPVAGDQPWVRERMEYRFSVAAPSADGETVLVASEYVDGRLDWHSFDAAPGSSLGAAGGPAPVMTSQSVLPTPVAFGGMPSPRFFELEDARIDFGRIEAGPIDLARMLLIEFATLFGNDHFVIPLDLEIGTLSRVASLVVTDTFGARTVVRPSGEAATSDGTWRMFRLTSSDPAVAPPDALFLPPTLGTALEGAPVEEILLLRDEMANMAWAVERVVESPTGRPVNRFEVHQEDRRRRERAAPPAAPTPAPAPLRYRIQTTVPPNWLPLLPVQVGPRRIRLQLREMLDTTVVPPAPIPAEGLLLTEGAGRLEIFDEEVSRAGENVRRSYQHARWTDGSTHVWIGRRKGPGGGEGSSGLKFDVVEPAEASEAP